jgi:DNA (cytosine-5)-methyltransferase 1
VLDAQNFGVAQRRRRVFVVGCLGGWESAAKVLFESESLSRDTKQSRKKEQKIAKCLTTRIRNDYETETILAIPIHAQATQYLGGGENRNNDGKGNGLGVGKPGDPMNTLDTSSRHAVAYENHGTDSRIKEIEISPTVTARWGTGGNNVPLAMGFNANARPNEMKFLQEQSNTLTTSQNSAVFCDTYSGTIQGDIAATMTADMAGSTHSGPKVLVSSKISGALRANPGSGWRSNGTPVEAVAIQNMAVRRLTEIECERLQGFPDNYTNIKENCPSGARYKALGNSMAVPVMRWIGERINNYERI